MSPVLLGVVAASLDHVLIPKLKHPYLWGGNKEKLKKQFKMNRVGGWLIAVLIENQQNI